MNERGMMSGNTLGSPHPPTPSPTLGEGENTVPRVNLPYPKVGEGPGVREQRTMLDKIWDSHVVLEEPGEPALLYVDLHFVHEVTSPQAFEGLRIHGRMVRRPERTVATMDHNVPTWERSRPSTDSIAVKQMEALVRNCEEFGVELHDLRSPRQGIVH